MLSKKFWFYLKTANVYLHYKLKRYIPFIVIITPTRRCNLKCEYCRDWKDKNRQDIKISKLYSLVDEIDKLAIPFISFTGGEPLLIKNIEDVAAYASRKNIIVNLNTNGTLIDRKRADKIAKSFDFIRLSLDGLEKVHDKISGIKGTYKKVIEALEYLTSVPNKTAKIGINYVLNKDNRKNLKKFNEIFKDKVDFISFIPEFSFCHHYKHRLNVTKEVIDNYKYLESVKKSGNTRDFIKKFDLDYSRNICDAGKLYLIIMSRGNIYACPFLPEKDYLNFRLGSIYKNSLYDILKNKQNIKFSNFCYGCHTICTTEISRIFRMSPFELLKNFFYLKKIYLF